MLDWKYFLLFIALLFSHSSWLLFMKHLHQLRKKNSANFYCTNVKQPNVPSIFSVVLGILLPFGALLAPWDTFVPRFVSLLYLIFKLEDHLLLIAVAPRDALLAFKVLDSSGRGRLELSEFLGVYEAVALRWQPCGEGQQPWFRSAQHPARILGEAARSVYDWKYFETLVCK